MPAFKEGVGMRNPDFARFAEACGGTGTRVSDPGQLVRLIERTLSTTGPAVLDVRLDPDDIPPMPEVHAASAVKFGIGKLRSLIGR